MPDCCGWLEPAGPQLGQDHGRAHARNLLKAFVDIGFTPPAPWFWTALFTETLAGIALILGLFTRFFAAAAAIELLIITAIYWHNGFSWLRQGIKNTRYSGAGFVLRLHCAAAVHIPLIAQSAKNYKAETSLNAQCPLLAQSGHTRGCTAHVPFGGKADIEIVLRRGRISPNEELREFFVALRWH